MEEIINIVANNGLAIGIAIYFLFKDFKQGAQMIASIDACTGVLNELKGVIGELKAFHLKEQEATE